MRGAGHLGVLPGTSLVAGLVAGPGYPALLYYPARVHHPRYTPTVHHRYTTVTLLYTTLPCVLPCPGFLGFLWASWASSRASWASSGFLGLPCPVYPGFPSPGLPCPSVPRLPGPRTTLPCVIPRLPGPRTTLPCVLPCLLGYPACHQALLLAARARSRLPANPRDAPAITPSLDTALPGYHA